MQLVTLPYTADENQLMDAMPSDVYIFILEHKGRKIYLVLDKEYDAGGHPAVYNTLEEITADFLHEAMHELKDVSGQ